MIIFFFSYAWVFFTMRDKVKTLPSRLPFVKRERNRVFFFLFFFLMKERCNLEGTRDYLYRILLHSECTYVFFEIRDYLWLMTRIVRR